MAITKNMSSTIQIIDHRLRVCARISKSLRIFIIPVLSNIIEFHKKLLYFISTIYCNKYAKIMNFHQEFFFLFKCKLILLGDFQGSH